MLSQLLGDHAPFATASLRPLVRLMIGGGDAALHQLAAALLVHLSHPPNSSSQSLCLCVPSQTLRLTKPKLLSDVDWRLYVVPTARASSGLAAYLAKVDPWYGRHVALAPAALLHCWPSVAGAPTGGASDDATSTTIAGGAPIDAELGAAIAGRANRIVAPVSRRLVRLSAPLR